MQASPQQFARRANHRCTHQLGSESGSMFVNYEAKDPGRKVATCGGWRAGLLTTLRSMDQRRFCLGAAA